MSEWRSIESAPKDGTPVLAWDGDKIKVALFDNCYLDPMWVDVCDCGYPEETFCCPTHWMPLPEPPNEVA